MDECLLTLIAAPELEERLSDWLLDRGYSGFSSVHGHGHGVGHGAMSAAEQVAGRKQQVIFWLQIPRTEAERVLAAVRENFPGAALHYWITPVAAAGSL